MFMSALAAHTTNIKPPVKQEALCFLADKLFFQQIFNRIDNFFFRDAEIIIKFGSRTGSAESVHADDITCLLYTSDAADD